MPRLLWDIGSQFQICPTPHISRPKSRQGGSISSKSFLPRFPFVSATDAQRLLVLPHTLQQVCKDLQITQIHALFGTTKGLCFADESSTLSTTAISSQDAGDCTASGNRKPFSVGGFSVSYNISRYPRGNVTNCRTYRLFLPSAARRIPHWAHHNV